MALSLDEYRATLINKILLAGSQQEVKQLIDAPIHLLKYNNVPWQSIAGFIEKSLSDLYQFSPLNEEAWQWINIKIARVLFNRAHYSEKSAVN